MESKIFKFYIPSNSTIKDEQQKIKSVTITAAPLLPGVDNILLAASTREDVTPSSASIKGVPGWKKGQTLRLSDDNQKEWCSGCYITILVDVREPGKYQIRAKSNVGVPRLY